MCKQNFSTIFKFLPVYYVHGRAEPANQEKVTYDTTVPT